MCFLPVTRQIHVAFEAGKGAGKAEALRSMRASRAAFMAWRSQGGGLEQDRQKRPTCRAKETGLRRAVQIGGGWRGDQEEGSSTGTEADEEEETRESGACDAGGAYDARFRVLTAKGVFVKPRYKVSLPLV